MSNIKQKLIMFFFKKYPTLFKGREDFSCGAGWFPLLDRLCADLVKIQESEENSSIQIDQIKEKFGGLRFYVQVGRSISERVYERISQAETESLTVCETCGSPGIPRTSSWIKVRCDKCEQEHLKSRV